jgi:3-hydroxyacyl-[acyl-carrier-protein] dehydratase
MSQPADFAAALSALPHGPEFRFVDKITALEPGKSAGARWCLPPDAPFLRGHFPGNPMMPGVLLIEALAQVAGIAAQSPASPSPHLRLAAVRSVKIRATAWPGEIIHITATITARMSGLILASGRVTNLEDEELLSGEVTLAAVES